MTSAEMLARLVAFDTTSRTSNLPLIRFVAEYLTTLGAAVEILPDADGSKANLLARIGPAVPGGVVLSGHTDVVPVDGQNWSSDPFTLTPRGSRLYGRGTADMKAFSAVALALAPQLARQPLSRPVILALSYDEEVGCLGAPQLVSAIAARGLAPSAVIVGEPTSMRVVNAHKGIHAYRTTVTGREAHSSATHRGVSAVMLAGDLLHTLGRIADDMIARGDPSGRFDPPYTTVQASVIEGGTALNILARHCAFSWESRTLPDADAGEILARFTAEADAVLARARRIAPEAAITTELVAHVPALAPEPEAAAESLALAAMESNAAEAVSYGTEAGLFQQAGLSVIVCGPGDIAQAHAADEFIEASQLDLCARFLTRLADRLIA